MLILDAIAAALTAVLTGLGVGSGGLMVIYLTLIAGIDQTAAQGINLLFFLCAGGSALTVHATRRHLYPAMILWTVLFGIGGSVLGSALAHLLPPTLLRRIFGGMLVFSGIASWLRADKTAPEDSDPPLPPFR